MRLRVVVVAQLTQLLDQPICLSWASVCFLSKAGDHKSVTIHSSSPDGRPQMFSLRYESHWEPKCGPTVGSRWTQFSEPPPVCGRVHFPEKMMWKFKYFCFFIPGRRKGGPDTLNCPVCKMALRSCELESHLLAEVEQLMCMSRLRRSQGQEPSTSSSTVDSPSSSNAKNKETTNAETSQDTRWDVSLNSVWLVGRYKLIQWHLWSVDLSPCEGQSSFSPSRENKATQRRQRRSSCCLSCLSSTPSRNKRTVLGPCRILSPQGEKYKFHFLNPSVEVMFEFWLEWWYAWRGWDGWYWRWRGHSSDRGLWMDSSEISN